MGKADARSAAQGPDRLFLGVTFAIGYLVFLYLAWACRGFYPLFGFNDDANYYLDALKLLEGSYLDQASAFLPGQPLVLAAAIAMFGAKPALLQAVATVQILAGSILVYFALRKVRDHLCATAITLCYLLTPVTVLHSTTLMSEVLFSLQVWGALFLVIWSGESEPQNSKQGTALVMAGVLVGWAVCTRSQGFFIVGGLGLAFLWFRRWRGLAAGVLGTAVACLLLFPLAQHSFSVYGRAVSMDTEYNLSFFLAWFKQLYVIWRDYVLEIPLLELPEWGGHLYLMTLVVLALVGFVSQLRRIHLLHWIGLVYFAGHLLWGFQFARYWIVFWPMLLLYLWDGAILVLQKFERRRVLAVGLLMVVGLVSLVTDLRAATRATAIREMTNQKAELFEAARKRIPEGSLLCSAFAAQVQALTGRDTVQLPPGFRFVEVLDGLAKVGPEYLLIDRQAEPIVGINGPNVPYPPGLEYRLEASPAFEQVYVDKWGSIYKLTKTPQELQQAYQHYHKSESLFISGQVQESLEESKRARALLPNQPEIEFQICRAALTLGHEDPFNELLDLLKTNPAYPEVMLGTSIYLRQAGRHAEAKELLEKARKVATVMKADDLVRLVDRHLADL